jgi:uncharacterized protein (TIGR02996 family)
MTYIDDLNRVLKYYTKQDWLHAIATDHNATPHLAYADWLDENNEPELAAKIREQAQGDLLGKRKPLVRLGDGVSDHDFVLNAIRHRHPNPTVRALAEAYAEAEPELHNDTFVGNRPLYRNQLVDLLLHSPQHYDQDVAVLLADHDRPGAHSATVSRINHHSLPTGLSAKSVRGTTYLTDEMQPDHKAFGAPAIVFTAPSADHSELAALEAHANHLAAERAAAEGATIGPVH